MFLPSRTVGLAEAQAVDLAEQFAIALATRLTS